MKSTAEKNTFFAAVLFVPLYPFYVMTNRVVPEIFELLPPFDDSGCNRRYVSASDKMSEKAEEKM